VEGVYYFTSSQRGDKIDCNNYRGISLLSTVYKMLSNVLLSRLGSYIDEIIGDHQCGFRHNRSATDQIFCIHQILEKKWEYNETVHHLFSEEGNIVQYSHRVWDTHETSHVD
jgi:sorting nexin-29